MLWKTVVLAIVLVALGCLVWLVMDGRAGAPTPPTPAAPEADLRVTGLVLGEGRHPAPGVEVELVTVFAAPVRTVTDARGRYRLPTTAAPDDDDPMSSLVTIHARAADGRAAVRYAFLSQAVDGELELPKLALGPGHSLVVRVEDVDGPVAGAEVVVTQGGRLAPLRSGVDGTVHITGIPEIMVGDLLIPMGFVFIQAHHPERGRAHATLPIGARAEPVVLTLSRRELTLRTVRAGTGEPVTDVPLRITFSILTPESHYILAYDPPLGVAATDGSGTAVMVVGAEDHVWVSPRTRSGVSRRYSSEATASAGETEATLELPRPHTYRWQLVPGDAPPLVEGEILELLPISASGQILPAETAKVVAGQLVIESVAADQVNCYALTGDGRIAWIRGRRDDSGPREATFSPQRTIEVIVRDESGAPVPGVRILARGRGNLWMPPVSTNAEGVARIGPLHGMLVDVSTAPPISRPVRGIPIGTVDLVKGDGRLEFTLKAKCRATLRVTCDGVSKLPDDFWIGWRAQVVAEDPVASTLLVEYDAAVRVRIGGRGYLTLVLDLPAGGSDEPIDVDLVGEVSPR